MADKTRADLMQELAGLQDRLQQERSAIEVQRKAQAVVEDRVAELEESLAETRRENDLLRRSSRSMLRHGHRSEQEASRREDICNLYRDCGSDLQLRLTREGKIKAPSPAALDLLGYRPEELEGRRLEDYLESEQQVAFRHFLRALEDTPGIRQMDVRWRRKDKRWTEATLFAKASPHPQTKENEAVVLVRRRDVQVLWDPGTAANRELASFLAHELNQPLTAIAALADALLRGRATGLLEEKDQAEGLADIARQAHRGAEMIRRLRGLAAHETLHLARVVPADLVRGGVDQLRPYLQDGEVRVDIDLPPHAPSFPGDPLLLEQVLTNLLRNAAEAMACLPVRDRRIEITGRVENDRFRLSVRDRGPGISPEREATLFRPYRTTKPGGLGLGLALCRIIVEAHRGKLTYRPAEDRGAVFTLDLPTVTQHEHHHPSERLSGR